MNTHDYSQIEKAALIRRRTVKVITYAFLIFWAVLVLFPFYWMLLTSVKGYGAYNSEWIPQLYTLAPTLKNYADAFTAVPLGQYFLNTVIFTVATTALMLIVIVPAAFAFSSSTSSAASSSASSSTDKSSRAFMVSPGFSLSSS